MIKTKAFLLSPSLVVTILLMLFLLMFVSNYGSFSSVRTLLGLLFLAGENWWWCADAGLFPLPCPPSIQDILSRAGQQFKFLFNLLLPYCWWHSSLSVCYLLIVASVVPILTSSCSIPVAYGSRPKKQNIYMFKRRDLYTWKMPHLIYLMHQLLLLLFFSVFP